MQEHAGDVNYRKHRIGVYASDFVDAARTSADEEGRVILLENYSMVPRYVVLWSQYTGVQVRRLPIGSKVKFDWQEWDADIPVFFNRKPGPLCPSVWRETDENGKPGPYHIIDDELISRDVHPDNYGTERDVTDKMCYWMRGLITDYQWTIPEFNEFREMITIQNPYEKLPQYLNGLLPKLVDEKIGNFEDVDLLDDFTVLGSMTSTRKVNEMPRHIADMLMNLGVFCIMYGITWNDILPYLVKARKKYGLPAVDD